MRLADHAADVAPELRAVSRVHEPAAAPVDDDGTARARARASRQRRASSGRSRRSTTAAATTAERASGSACNARSDADSGPLASLSEVQRRTG